MREACSAATRLARDKASARHRGFRHCLRPFLVTHVEDGLGDREHRQDARRRGSYYGQDVAKPIFSNAQSNPRSETRHRFAWLLASFTLLQVYRQAFHELQPQLHWLASLDRTTMHLRLNCTAAGREPGDRQHGHPGPAGGSAAPGSIPQRQHGADRRRRTVAIGLFEAWPGGGQRLGPDLALPIWSLGPFKALPQSSAG